MNNFIGNGLQITCELPPLLFKVTMSSCVAQHVGFAKMGENLPKGERYIWQ